jgi:hypothetical protein
MTIAELWDQTPQNIRAKIISCIILDGYSASTAYNYVTGRQFPKLFYQKRINVYINLYTGKNIPVAELFPPLKKTN